MKADTIEERLRELNEDTMRAFERSKFQQTIDLVNESLSEIYNLEDLDGDVNVEQCKSYRNDILILKAQALTFVGEHKESIELYDQLKGQAEGLEERLKIIYHKGFNLMRYKQFPQAEAEFKAIVKEQEKDIVPVEVQKWACKAYERLASLKYDNLAFQTAKEYLDKAEAIVNENYAKDSFEYLEFQKKLSIYYKKFMDNTKSLDILKNIYRVELSLCKDQSDAVEMQESKEEPKKGEQVEAKVEEVEDEGEVPDEPVAKEVKDNTIVNSIERNLDMRIANTFKMIMNVYANMRQFKNASKFEENALKKYQLALGEEENAIELVGFYNLVGDIALKEGKPESIDRAEEMYKKANQILVNTVGEKSVDYLYSQIDLADILFERKKYDEAKEAYTKIQDQVSVQFGEKSIFKGRIYSAQIELMAATGDQNSCLMLSMANMQLAIENYGETDLSCLSYYLSGISQVAQIGEIQGKTDQGTLENILSKMLKVLEANQETQNGNQYFFLASIMLGSICIAKQQYEQAHLFFHGTMQKQLKYVGEVADHPFLEQTYLHLALLYKQLKNLNASLTMWQNLKKVHERQFGENKHYLSSDLKNIGTCQLGLNKADDAIESYKEAEGYLIDVLESGRLDEKETKDERIQLSAIYFSLYLSYLSKEDFDNATIYNEKSLATNIQIHGEFDVNISNNHYLASQMLLKQLKTKEACGRIDEALKIYAELQKKNDLGIQKTPVIGCKYMALKAKICKIMGQDEEAMNQITQCLNLAEKHPSDRDVQAEKMAWEEQRRSIVYSISPELQAKFNINLEEEKRKEKEDKEKQAEIQKQAQQYMQEQYMKQLQELAQRPDLSEQDRAAVMQKMQQIQGQQQQEKQKEVEAAEKKAKEEESFIETPLGGLAIMTGIAAVGAGIWMMFRK